MPGAFYFKAVLLWYFCCTSAFEPRSRLGPKLLEIWLVCPQNGTAVLKELISIRTTAGCISTNNDQTLVGQVNQPWPNPYWYLVTNNGDLRGHTCYIFCWTIIPGIYYQVLYRYIAPMDGNLRTVRFSNVCANGPYIVHRVLLALEYICGNLKRPAASLYSIFLHFQGSVLIFFFFRLFSLSRRF